MRLNKYLAHATGMSRRDADTVIAAGRVSINDARAILGSQVNDNDVVTFDRKEVHPVEALTYLLLNKPVGYLCSRRSQGGVPTIFELLPEKYRPLKTVGRLDKDSSGLILLTNDGDFAHRMTHPSFHKVKVYEVELDKALEPLHQQMISDYGIDLEDGRSQFLVEKIDSADSRQPTADRKTQRTEDRESGRAGEASKPLSFLDTSATSQQRGAKEMQLAPSGVERKDGGSERYQITMHEGRNRQIRRTFAALGYTVTKLHRISFGNYSLGDIKTGEHTLVDIR